MDAFYLISLFVLFFLLLLGIPIGSSYLIYRWMKKRNVDRRIRIISLAPIILLIYIVYDSIYPSDDFYKEDYKEVTNHEFPKSGNIISKSASFPDHFGDYTSSALIELDSSEYHSLQSKLIENKFVIDSTEFGSNEREHVERELNGRIYIKKMNKELSGGKHYFVGFLSDEKSIVYQRISW